MLRKRTTIENGQMILTVASDPVADYATLSVCGPMKADFSEIKLSRGLMTALIGLLQDHRNNVPGSEED